MSLVTDVIFYLILALGIVVFLKIDRRTSLLNRLFITIAVVLILLLLFFFISTIIAIILVVVLVLILLSLLNKRRVRRK